MIDITKPELFKTLKLADLVADAVERGSSDGLDFLEAESTKMVKRTKDGTEFYVKNPIISYRTKYLVQFCGYVPASKANAEKAKARKQEKDRKALEDMFAKARAQLKK